MVAAPTGTAPQDGFSSPITGPNKSALHSFFFEWGRWLACIVALLTVGAFGFGIHHLLGLLHNRIETSRHNETREELTQVIGHLGRLSQVESRFQEIIGRVIRGLRFSGDPPPSTQAFPGDRLRLILFDERGKRVPRDGFDKDFLRGSEKYLDSLLRVSRGEPFQFGSDEARLAESFSGSPETVAFLANRPNSLLDLRPLGLSKFGGWFRLTRRSRETGHLLVWCDLRDIPHERLAAEACARLARIAPREFSFGAILRDAKPGRTFVLAGKPPAKVALRRILQHRLPPTFRHGNRLFATASLNSGICLYASRALPRLTTAAKTLQTLVFPGVGTLMLLLIWGFAFLPGFPLTIRQQLVLIFGTAGFLGLGILLSHGHLYREARQENLIRDSQEQALQRLEKIDTSFRPAFNHLVRRYVGFIGNLEKHPEQFSSILKPLLADQRQGRLLTACLIDPSGKIIFRAPTSANEVPGGIIPMGSEQLFGNVGKAALDRYNSQIKIVASGTRSKEAPLSVVLERPVDRMLRERGSLQVVQLAGDGITTFVDVVLGPSGKAWAVLMILHDTRAMESAYLRRMARKIRTTSDQRLLAIPRGAETGLTAIPNSSRSREESVRVLFERVHRFGGTGHHLGTWGGVPALLSAMPGKSLQDFQLMLASPLTPIARRSREITNRFLVLGGTFILFALFLGVTLAHRLLEPIRTLSAGIDNLTAMRLGQRLSLSTGDELETIGNGINSLMGELSDLALAKTVQDHLLPQKPLTVGEYGIRGWSHAAGTLAGGYFDYQATADGRVAFFLGETPGKGISSALIMAMVKIVLRLCLDGDGSANGPAAERLMVSLNQVLREQLHRPHPLRFLCGFLRPETGHVTITAAGLPGFLHLAPQAAWISLPDSHPLGIVNHPGFAATELEIKPGECLLVGTSTLLSAFGWETPGASSRFDWLRDLPFDQLASRLQREMEFQRGSAAPLEYSFLALERRRA